MKEAINLLEIMYANAVKDNYPSDFKVAIEKCIKALRDKELSNRR